GFTRVRPLNNVAEVGSIRLRLGRGSRPHSRLVAAPTRVTRDDTGDNNGEGGMGDDLSVNLRSRGGQGRRAGPVAHLLAGGEASFWRAASPRRPTSPASRNAWW